MPRFRHLILLRHHHHPLAAGRKRCSFSGRAPPSCARRSSAIAMAPNCILLVPILIFFLQFPPPSSATSETALLLKFRDALTIPGKLSTWNNTMPPCSSDHENWMGVFCDKGSVWGLQLYNLGLKGEINVEALSGLPNLKTISLMNNEFDGALPNFTQLPTLKTLYLSNNKFSGEIPSSTFVGMLGLKKLHMANNQFSGAIPASLAALPKLMELMVENNLFEGDIPMFPSDRIKNFNASFNLLDGQVPSSLAHFPASAFQGNRHLCGEPLESCASPQRLSLITIINVSMLVAMAIASLIAVFIILHRRRPPPELPVVPPAIPAPAPRDLDRVEQGELVAAELLSPVKSGHNRKKSEPSVKITFLRDGIPEFDMADLLKASAEILGSGVFGSTYKAVLSDKQAMVVKRFRHMNNVNKQEFHEHMRRLGRLHHPNVLPLVGFYYRKEEKLLVTDYVERVSLASHLHGNRSRSHDSLDWPTRLKIVKGIANGLLYLYHELPSLTAPHGHLKSSNVLLDASYTPFLTDYGLVPVVNQEHAEQHMISYKSPEFKLSGRITKKTDTWSLGILIVEILTGRFPFNFLQQGKSGDMDIGSWVESVIRDEENDVDVFDVEMERDKKCEGEMMKLLKIGFDCCQVDVDMRPDIKAAVEKIEEVKEIES